MAKYGSGDVAFLLVDGYNLLGYCTEFSDDKEDMFEPSHVLGDTWEAVSRVGLRKGSIDAKCFYDDALLATSAALVGKSGQTRVICYGVQTNAKGKAFTGLQGGVQMSAERVAQRGALTRINPKFVVTGQIDEGVILHELAAETGATGNTQSTSHDNAASSANGAAYHVQIVALTLGGYTAVTVQFQDSADNVTFADIAGAAAISVGAAPYATRVVVAGTVRRYTAVRWAYSGAGSGQSVTFMAGIARF